MDTETFINRHTGTNVEGDKIADHAAMDYIRNANLIKAIEENNFSDKLYLPRPVGCTISINDKEIESLKAIYSLKENKSALGELIIEVVTLLTEKNRLDANILASFIANMIHYHIAHISESAGLTKIIHDKFFSFHEKLSKTDALNFEDYDTFLEEMSHHEYVDSISEHGEERISENYPQCSHMIKLLSIIRNIEFSKKGRGRNYFYLEMGKPEEFSYFVDFISIYFETKTITDYLSINWEPGISAGEYSQLNLYSRLYYLTSGERQLDKEVLLFMDETEITIHPDEQIELIYNLINFLNTFFAGFKFHIIFATHSPILLSDIPRSNTILLKRKTGKVTVEPSLDYPETFGANIHSLYRHSFFLEKGTVSKFAAGKINKLIQKIDELSPDAKDEASEYIENGLKIIGEPFIKKKIQEYYWEKLSQIGKESVLEAKLHELEAEASSIRSKLPKSEKSDSDKK